MKAYVFAQNELTDDQILLVEAKFGPIEDDAYRVVPIPQEGFSIEDMNVMLDTMFNNGLKDRDVVFIDPVPYLMGVLSYEAGFKSTRTHKALYAIGRVCSYYEKDGISRLL